MKRVLPTSDSPLLPQVSLTTMPSDIITVVLRTMKPWDVLTFQLVCKNWKQLFSENFVWNNLLQKRFPHYRVPNEITDLQKAFKDQYQQMDWNFDHGVYALDTYPVCPQTVESIAAFGGKVCCSDIDKTIYILDLDQKTPFFTETRVLSSSNRLFPLAISERKLFYGLGKMIYCYDLDNRTGTLTLRLDAELRALAASDGKVFYSTGDGKIHVWDFINNTSVGTVDGDETKVTALAASNRKFFSAGSHENTGKIKVWDSTTLTCTAILNADQEENPTTALAISNGKLIAGNDTGDIQVWRLDNLTNPDFLFSAFENYLEVKFLTASRGKILFAGPEDKDHIQVMDFNADHNKIFEQLADYMERSNPADVVNGINRYAEEAGNRFDRMPKAAKDKIFGELTDILKRENPADLEAAEYEVWDIATFTQKAQAIRNYLQNQTPS